MMLAWTDKFALGHEAIDNDHRYAVEQMGRIASADDSGVVALFGAFVEHMHEHFAREEELMRACAFPAYDCHADEHQRVLGLLDSLAAEVAGGNIAAARAFATEAGPAWFLDHRATMDQVTVTFARTAARS